MALRKKKVSYDQRRLISGSTKKGMVLRRPARPGRIVAIVLSAVAVVALALMWGSHLKDESAAYHEALEMGAWTVNEHMTVSHPVPVPDMRAISVKPEGNVGDILIAGKHDGVIMTMLSDTNALMYTSDIGSAANLSVISDAIPLAKDVERVQKRGLRVTCAFTVSCFATDTPALRTYRRGLDLALLRECAEAGVDDLLLFGLPVGNETADATTVEFIQDLRILLSDLPSPPAIGVALPLSAYATDHTYISVNSSEDASVGIPDGTIPLYAGNITPARILNTCDYLAMDLRHLSSDGIAATLPHIRYAYVRYSLRLLADQNNPTAVEKILFHGFKRVFEMNPPANQP